MYPAELELKHENSKNDKSASYLDLQLDVLNGDAWHPQNRPDQNRTDKNRIEQNRTEQSRREQNRTEQNRYSM